MNYQLDILRQGSGYPCQYPLPRFRWWTLNKNCFFNFFLKDKCVPADGIKYYTQEFHDERFCCLICLIKIGIFCVYLFPNKSDLWKYVLHVFLWYLNLKRNLVRTFKICKTQQNLSILFVQKLDYAWHIIFPTALIHYFILHSSQLEHFVLSYR